MPALAPVTLNGLSDVEHVFTPRGIDAKGVATLVKPGTTPLADEKLTVSVVQTSTGKFRSILKLSVPKVQDVVINGVTKPTVVKTSIATIEFSSDPSATHDDRLEMAKLVGSMMFQAGLQSMVADNAPYY